MPYSIESQRPIMAPSVSLIRRKQNGFNLLTILSKVTSSRNSKRFSTISGTSNATTSTITGGRIQDIKQLATGLDRLESQRLQQQRYTPTSEKLDTLSKIALGAKLERALDRRMANQDAIYTPRTKVMSEKVAT